MKKKICILGIGYVGLPLAIEFSKNNHVIGFDTNKKKIKILNKGIDPNNDLRKEELKILKKKKNLKFSYFLSDISDCNIFIITVPTPIYKNKNPDLKFIISATKSIAKILKKGDIVIYESTVFPGTTEDICVPILERISKLKLNEDFYVGYSPERLSPGSKNHGLKNIIKITSGSNKYALAVIDDLYKGIIKQGTYPVKSIKIAEAAKVIENTQRDINIAFINELAQLFSSLKINTNEVLQAASTKWNFSKFQPGLVGGHCIAVDPYYLQYIGKRSGYNSKLIKASRSINDSMSKFVSNKLLNNLKLRKFNIKKSKVLLLGFAYKENCSDTRNTPVFSIYKYLINKIKTIDIFDPNVNAKDIKKNFNLSITKNLNKNYDAIIFSVPHNNIFKYLSKLTKKFKPGKNFVIDIKYVLKNKKYDVIPI